MKENKQQLKEVCKKIDKCIRDKKQIKKTRNISGSWKISKASRTYRASNLKRSTLIPKVKNGKRETITSRKGTANVFGEFYSKLYAEERFEEKEHDPHISETRTRKGGKRQR